MAILEQIDKAITAHGQWKVNLRNAIDTGHCESTPERVRQDDNCAFGKWLHHHVEPAQKRNPHYTTAMDLHARFHREAGDILAMASAGEKTEAEARMAMGSPFRQLSARLTNELQDWKADLTAT